jgi:indole-3-glycerol phosphate synthase
VASEGGVLERIGQRTQKRIDRLKRLIPIEALREERLYRRVPRSLRKAIFLKATSIIAEVKFSSPSKGVLRAGASASLAVEIARQYVAAGACAVSVLTEPEFFAGDHAYLTAVREADPDVCLLMKDFFIDEYQLELARACGADAILLIASLLGPRLADMARASQALGLSTLIEVHNEIEAEAALACGVDVLGVNNRNLRTLKTDLEVARRLSDLARRAPAAVAESGLHSRMEISELAAFGYRAFLIGTAFMQSPDPGLALAGLLKP